ncbi:hypothetical protein CPLU01_07503 [Colletotrichum plurivorum]|uniref:Uncharacterized protein n=1 Tax=Colletotrichum plurivorum TaxID=2175906 RepID=A0A8H6NEA9_9PEZI|nr:hypothetical protein CPLU01_07503 [Colletotrichum plurivorum]
MSSVRLVQPASASGGWRLHRVERQRLPTPRLHAPIQQLSRWAVDRGFLEAMVTLSCRRAELGSQGSRVAGEDTQDRTGQDRAPRFDAALCVSQRSGNFDRVCATATAAALSRVKSLGPRVSLQLGYARRTTATLLHEEVWLTSYKLQVTAEPMEKQYSKRGGSSLDTMPAVQLNLRPRRSTSWAVDSSPRCRAAAPWQSEWRMGPRIPMGSVSLGRYAGVDMRYERQPAKIPGAPVTNRQEEVQIGLCPMGHPCRTLVIFAVLNDAGDLQALPTADEGETSHLRR